LLLLLCHLVLLLHRWLLMLPQHHWQQLLLQVAVLHPAQRHWQELGLQQGLVTQRPPSWWAPAVTTQHGLRQAPAAAPLVRLLPLLLLV
jgi:hypothetical protein